RVGLQKTDKKENRRRLSPAPKRGRRVFPPELSGTLSCRQNRGQRASLLRLRWLRFGRGLLLLSNGGLAFDRFQFCRRLPLQRGLAVGVFPPSCTGIRYRKLVMPGRTVGCHLLIRLKRRDGLGASFCRVQRCPQSEVRLHEGDV